MSSRHRPQIEPERIVALNGERPAAKAGYVLYWMQASQRARHNPALELAVSLANEAGLPCLVGFGLTDGYPEANERHYAFMLEGMRETRDALLDRGVGFSIRRGDPADIALELAKDAALVVCDRGYLRHQKAWRRKLAEGAGRQVLQVEADVVVPVETASSKAEIGARTLRPRIGRHVDRFLVPLEPIDSDRDGTRLKISSDIELDDTAKALASLDIDRSVARSSRFAGGTGEAVSRLERFIDERLDDYAEGRNEPSDDKGSHLSPYLHFGQISPVEIALAVRGAKGTARPNRDSYLEELIVRRELAMNYVHYTQNYDSFDAMPGWAKTTLEAHDGDSRPNRYRAATLEAAKTDDRYWNAAMLEMVKTGYMHNYMRMYWGKQILGWAPHARAAYGTVLALNNKYFLDGRDPNSFGNVGWIFGLHDRAWTERDVFGKVRIMVPAGLKRKFDIDAYCEWAEGLE